MSRREKLAWSLGTVLTLVIIFYLLLAVSPKIKQRQAAPKPAAVTTTGAPGASPEASGH
jgi:hypothetical protein